jgi:hypothetical protein
MFLMLSNHAEKEEQRWMKTKEKITKMEQMLETILNQQTSINISSQEYTRHIELMLRLQDSINQLKQHHQYQQYSISPE